MKMIKALPVWFARLVFLIGVAACTVAAPTPSRDADIIVVGDSILAWHRAAGLSIPDVVADATGRIVSNLAVSGARFLGPQGIPTQFVAGDWDWVIVDGGGNDLGAVCGSPDAARVLDAIVTADGRSGAMAEFVTQAASGAQVIVLGYYPISDQGGPFVPCRAELGELATRQARLAAGNDNVVFVDAGLVIGSGDINAYAPDLVHPSPRGTALIGQLIASTIRRNGG